MENEKKLERKIGTEFFSGFYGKSYKVCTPRFANKCKGCAFDAGKKAFIADGTTYHICNAITDEVGQCTAKDRSDGIDVIFKEVEVCKR